MSDEKQSATSLGSGDFRQNSKTENPGASADSFNRRSFRGVPPLPHELTAEWTVRAQLTFARAGETVRKEFSHSDPIHPVRVVYKWTTFDDGINVGNDDDDCDDNRDVRDDDGNDNDNDDDDDVDFVVIEGECHDTASANTCNKKRRPTPLKQHHNQSTNRNRNRESFRSTTSSTNPDNGGGDSAFSGSTNTSRKHQDDATMKQKKRTTKQTTNIGDDGTATAAAAAAAMHYGTRCRSTCNIIVTAVADFLPSSSNNTSFNSRGGGAASSSHQSVPEEPDPFVFNTTASYTVLPEKSVDESNMASQNFSTFGKILNLRDAICQTSGLELNRCVNDKLVQSPNQLQQQQKRKLNERNRTMEAEAAAEAAAAAAALLQPLLPFLDEGNSFSPSFTPSPVQTCKSSSLPRIPPLPPTLGQSLSQNTLSRSQNLPKSMLEQQKKPPRTVHIDVYCTGSDEEEDEGEDDADNDATPSSPSSSSSSSSAGRAMDLHEIESNSTPQTILNSEQMLLRHQRVSEKSQLPRRMVQNQNRRAAITNTPQTTKKTSNIATAAKATTTATATVPQTTQMSLGHAITKSSTVDEINESKQLLLRKHVGDQRAAKLQNLRSKYLRKDPSDDCISSNYPNSSRSTMRDATCSSISSSVAQSPATAATVDSDFVLWKDTIEDIDSKCSLTKSDSFEYDNSVDRLRIRQMERFWSQTDENFDGGGGDDGIHMQPTFLHSISETNPTSACTEEVSIPYRTEPETESRSGAVRPQTPLPPPSRVYSPRPPTPTNLNPSTFLHYFGPQARNDVRHDQQHFSRYRSTIQRGRKDLLPEDAETLLDPPIQRGGSETRSLAERTEIPMAAERRRSNEAPPVLITGCYTQEYLDKARKFGPVMEIIRKPGHHIGPTKNSNCLCGSCQRWMAERLPLRARGNSVGDKLMAMMMVMRTNE